MRPTISDVIMSALRKGLRQRWASKSTYLRKGAQVLPE